MRINKRGVSPLIATVLLIGFSLAIAAMVITFMTNKAKSLNPEEIVGSSQYCGEVAFQVQAGSCELFPGGLEGCNNLKATTKVLKDVEIKNKGSFTIRKVKISSPGLDVPVFEDNIKPSSKGTIPELKVCLGDDTEGIIRFTPFIKNDKSDKETVPFIPCGQNQVEFNANEFCNK